jgi:membrane-associated phospholipid phosphatase
LSVEAALVCLSRVYVGGHYLLDIVGGILMGGRVLFLFIGLDVINKWKRENFVVAILEEDKRNKR